MDQCSRKRLIFIISLILTVCLALTAVLTETFIFQNLDHTCSGEDCPLCLQIETARSLLKGFVFASFVIFSAGVSARKEMGVKTASFSAEYSRTLVLLKVQSNS